MYKGYNQGESPLEQYRSQLHLMLGFSVVKSFFFAKVAKTFSHSFNIVVQIIIR